MTDTNQFPEGKTKNITFGLVVGWVLGLGSALAGVTYIASQPMVGVLYLLVAFILIPPISRGIQKKLHINLSRGLRIGLVLVLLAIVGTTMSGSSDKTKVASNSDTSSTQQAPVEPAIQVSAVKLVADYKANEVSADAKYKGKLVEVKGTVSSIAKDILDTPYIALSDGQQYSFESVQCMFGKNQESELANVAKGQVITLQGEVSGKLGNVLIRECKIVQ